MAGCMEEGLGEYLIGVKFGGFEKILPEALKRIRSMTEALLESVSLDDQPVVDVRSWREP